MPYLDIAGVHDDEARERVTFFAVNRHATETLETEIALRGFNARNVALQKEMIWPDLRAANTLGSPDRIVPKDVSGAELEGDILRLKLLPHSYQVIRIGLDA